MLRFRDNYFWLLLIGLAVAVTVACSSSTSPEGDAGGASDALTPG
jgi:hypothetical protein